MRWFFGFRTRESRFPPSGLSVQRGSSWLTAILDFIYKLQPSMTLRDWGVYPISLIGTP